MELQGFVGSDVLVSLSVSGPTRITLSFPKHLIVTSSTPQNGEPTTYSTFASGLNLMATILAALLAVLAVLARRRKRNHNRPRPDYFVSPTPAPRPPNSGANTVLQSPVPTQPPITLPKTHPDVQPSSLRVDVLGPLTISPTFAPASDPVRAIVAFLAMNNDRLLTLDEIQTAIWPLTSNGTDIKKPAMRNYMVDVRKTIGGRHLPTASGTCWLPVGGLRQPTGRSSGVGATKRRKSSKADAMILRRQALDLAKGPPFTADTSRYFTWTFTSSMSTRSLKP